MPPGLPTFAQPEEVQSSDVSMIDQEYSDEYSTEDSDEITGNYISQYVIRVTNI